jgi:hypothetical protein
MEEDDNTDEEEYCLMAKEPATSRQPNSQEFTRTTWLADSAASCHLINDGTYLYNLQTIHSPVKIGNGKTMMANKMGNMRVHKVQANGDTEAFILQNVKNVPELWVNLLGIPLGFHSGYNIGNVGLNLF